jgi:tripartite-type tricarboxylate transporter receptor subunit TctC
MMLTRRVFLHGLTGAAAAATLGGPALADTYPSRLIKIIVPFPPGGPTDVFARIIADKLSKQLKQTVIVESKPGGGGGTIGAKFVANSTPDGYTLLFALTGTLSIAPAIYKNSGYDPLKNFAPVAKIATGAQVLVVNPSVPAKTLGELVAYAKAHPGKINCASPGYGTQPHLLAELFKSVTKTNILHVPYKGSAPAIVDLLSGQVQMLFDSPASLAGHVKAGKLRALAVTTEKRASALPDVPTVVEAGYPGLLATLWGGIVAPAGTPAPVVEMLNKAINADLRTDEMRGKLVRFAMEPDPLTPAEFKTFFAEEVKKWADIVHNAGIKPQ